MGRILTHQQWFHHRGEFSSVFRFGNVRFHVRFFPYNYLYITWS